MKACNILIIFLLFIFIVPHANASQNPGDSLHAVKYIIELHEVDMTAQSISATTSVSLTPLVDDLETATLELMQLTVDSVFLDGLIASYTYENDLIRISLPAPVSPGDTFELKLHYHGQPFHESWGGFHYSGNYAFNLGVGISWIPHNLGKTWFPCIDDFTDRALYEVKATVSEDVMAIGGGELVELTNNGNGTQTFHWVLGHPIPTYLVSIAIGEYALVEDSYAGLERDIPITYYVKPGDTGKVGGTFSRMHQIMDLYEDKFGPYDWHRIGYVGTAIGAMEHATNIAYPHFAINGNSAYEDLYAHELSHMWFGDKVTCDKAEEMWINEGWATFCQYFYVEALDGPEFYKVQMRDMHADVLHSCHTEEGGFHPLNNIPQDYTYGTSAYDRGATVVQALRAYLGDEAFFEACKYYLEDRAFTSVDSYEMEASFSASTGIDMSGFFNNWVYHGGRPNYSVDSFSVEPHMGTTETTVYLKQKRHGPEFIGDNNIIEVTFMDEDWNTFTDTVHFSGASGQSTKIVPFYPTHIFLDLEERFMDATVDNYHVVKESGETSFPETYFNLDVGEISDSAFIQAVHNYAPADTFATPVAGLRVSDYRYWSIKGIIPESFSATGRFFYSKSGLDYTLISSASDSVVILYRPHAGIPWQAVDFSVVGSWSIGYIYVENIQMGDYTLGVWDLSVSTDENKTPTENEALKIFPNPSSGQFNFVIHSSEAETMEIYTMGGELLERIQIEKNNPNIRWDPSDLAPGTYVAILRGSGKKVISSSKILRIE